MAVRQHGRNPGRQRGAGACAYLRDRPVPDGRAVLFPVPDRCPQARPGGGIPEGSHLGLGFRPSWRPAPFSVSNPSPEIVQAGGALPLSPISRGVSRSFWRFSPKPWELRKSVMSINLGEWTRGYFISISSLGIDDPKPVLKPVDC